MLLKIPLSATDLIVMRDDRMLFDVEDRQVADRQVEDQRTVLRLGAREIAVAFFMVAVLIGTFSGVTYVVGRTMIPVEKVEASESPSEQVLVIQAPQKETESSDPTAASGGSDRSVARAADVKTPANRTTARTAAAPEPKPGKLYFQVVAADLGVAKVFVEYLSERNFSSLITEGPDERNYRVLVGPIQTDKQVEELRAGLEAAGFKPFLRRYSGEGLDMTAIAYEADEEQNSMERPESARAADIYVATI